MEMQCVVLRQKRIFFLNVVLINFGGSNGLQLLRIPKFQLWKPTAHRVEWKVVFILPVLYAAQTNECAQLKGDEGGGRRRKDPLQRMGHLQFF